MCVEIQNIDKITHEVLCVDMLCIWWHGPSGNSFRFVCWLLSQQTQLHQQQIKLSQIILSTFYILTQILKFYLKL